jgi:hypothetical protein
VVLVLLFLFLISVRNPHCIFVYCTPLSKFLEDKQTVSVNETTKSVTFDKINAEIFYSQRKENKEMTALLHKMAVEVATCLLKELCDPKKATSDYLTSEDDDFSWGNTTDKEHEACFGKMATNNPAEAPFAALPQQLQSFGCILGIHASGLGQTKVSDDFDRDLNDGNKDGAYSQLPQDIHDSLLEFALSIAPEVRKREATAVNRQRTAKLKKHEMLTGVLLRAFISAHIGYMVRNVISSVGYDEAIPRPR